MHRHCAALAMMKLVAPNSDHLSCPVICQHPATTVQVNIALDQPWITVAIFDQDLGFGFDSDIASPSTSPHSLQKSTSHHMLLKAQQGYLIRVDHPAVL
ncbi:hypothetical protein PAXRUDRAFT_310624 [Paxillus rubicundulus Ve08.2h10]|uniref:Uncharacterized protein n=1 Tax=Paxillus rubicundulus Ve08.2h10 TaxID=930991 RepID=A0A0D0DFF4_9AGAM|nr:hypothetical protein PAXRUDRAFT_310624 [Paxillus rubicundulus Ve08.2h10]